jgi:DNA-binding MarR family transcriptional regulator
VVLRSRYSERVPNSTEDHRETTNSADSDWGSASFAVQALISIADRRKGIDAARSRLALLHAETATLLHGSLRRALARRGLSDLQFAILVILFSTEPEPLAASVLAEHAAVSRASVTEALDKLEARHFVSRIRDDVDRRVMYVRITPTGQDMVDVAVNDYLHAAAEAARLVRPAEQRALFAAYLQLLRGLTKRGEAPHAHLPSA